MYKLSMKQLLELYNSAIKANLSNDFIVLVADEIQNRMGKMNM